MSATDQSHETLIHEAKTTLGQPSWAWFWSAVGAGMLISFSFIAAAGAYAAAPEGWEMLAAAIAYPLGFLLVVGGHYQLFTENTLAPVARVLERVTSIPRLVWMWTVILMGNLLGAVAVGTFLALPGVLPEAVREAAPHVMSVAHEIPMSAVFSRALLAGWLVAAMVWLLHHMKSAGPVLVIWVCAGLMPLLSLEHIVVGSVEGAYAFVLGLRGAPALVAHLTVTLFGNIAGGVLLVTVVNHARTEPVRPLGKRLSWRDMWTTLGPASMDSSWTELRDTTA